MVKKKYNFTKNLRKRKPREKFKITIKSSSLPEEEKRKILFECYDILLSNSNFSKHPVPKEKNNRPEEKLRRLKELNEQLNPPEELGGVFLPMGIKERFDIIFVAEMPSRNEPEDKLLANKNFNFNVTGRDKFLQDMMIKSGVAGSYITDIVKRRDVPRKPTKEEIEKWAPFLLKEIEIIRPRAIVVLGKRTYEGSFKPFIENLIPEGIIIKWVYHYSQQGSKTNEEVEAKFAEVVSKIKESLS